MGQLHLIPKRDFLMIEEEMRKLIVARRRAQRHVAGVSAEGRRTAPAKEGGTALPQG